MSRSSSGLKLSETRAGKAGPSSPLSRSRSGSPARRHDLAARMRTAPSVGSPALRASEPPNGAALARSPQAYNRQTALPGLGATTGNADQRRVLNQGNPQNAQFAGTVFGAVRAHRGNVSSSYNGLQIQVSRRFASGFSMSHGYTWSHSIDNASGRRVSSRFDPAQDRGNSEYDVRHNYTMAYVYELPFYRSQTGARGRFLGGWGISGRTALLSGLYLSLVEPTDRCLCSTGNVRADATGKTLAYLDPRSTTAVPGRPNSWFDGTGGGTPTAAANPYFRRLGSGTSAAQGAGRYGNAGRNSIRAPGINEWHVSLFEWTSIREAHVLEFCTEFYNVLNHANFMAPDVSTGSPNFGVVTQTRPPRIIQLVLKYDF
jgi:hypothetical protein